MKKSLLSAAAVAVLGLLLGSFAFAQDNDQDKEQMVSAVSSDYVISAKAGGVNYVEGKVTVVHTDGKSGILQKRDSVEIGDKVTTGDDGKAEILLNPGSFVRLGANAEFEFQTTDLDDLKLKLSAGSAIFEVYADDEFKVTLGLPDAELVLTKSGVYRIDVLKDGSGNLTVWKGRVIFDEQEIRAGKTAVIKGKSPLAAAKFDRDNKDAFDIWSDLRAKEATKINKRLQRNSLTNSLLGSYNRGGWNIFNTFGLWVLDPLSGRWSFLPFGTGWSSPYGYTYNFNIYHCSLPRRVYDQPSPSTPTPSTVPSTRAPNTMTPRNAELREERKRDMRTPTFQRFENNQRTESRNDGGRRNDDGNSGGGWNNGGGNSGGGNNGGGWNNSRNDSPSSSPSQTTNSSPASQPVRSTPSVESRTESKEVRKID